MYRFIVNPAAGSWHGKQEWEKIEDRIRRLPLTYEVYYTEYAGHAGELARSLGKLPDTELLGVVGGDGTLNEFAQGYDCERAVPVFYIPNGSGNDFARGLKLKVDRETAADYLADLSLLTLSPVDIGSVTAPGRPKKRYMVSSGIGFDAAVCYDMLSSTVKKKLNDLHMGKLAYLLVGIKNMFGCPLVKGSLTADGEEQAFTHLAFLSAHNLPYEGGGFFFAPKAVTGDGRIDLCLVTARNHLGFITRLAGSVFKGRHIRMKGVSYLQCREAALRLEKPLCLHADGEVLGFYSEVSFRTGDGVMRLYR